MKLKGKWKRLSGAVFESVAGTRVHMLGLIKTGGEKWNLIDTDSAKHRKQFYLCLGICGRNRKRALMLMAENLSDLEC